MKNSSIFYFTDGEYNIFAREYIYQRTSYLEGVRKNIQQKLLDLNKEVLVGLQAKKLELFNHSNSKNITSLIFPCQYNGGRVNWLGVRYGKHPADIRDLNKLVGGSDTDPQYAFQKHACMQVNVGYNGIDIGIFHAVPKDAVDRMYLHDHMDNNDIELVEKINSELAKLKGYGYVWNIWDTSLESVDLPDFRWVNISEKVYRFDNENDQDFISWYSSNDKVDCYSSMLVHFPRYDKRISRENIVDTVVTIFEQLYPLYKLISWNIHYTGKVEI